MRIVNRIYITIVFILIASISEAAEEKCPFPDFYIQIDISYHECRNGHVKRESSCDFFIDNISKLFPSYNCKRSFDTGSVPAIWLFGAAGEDYISLIYDLAVNKETKGHEWFSRAKKKAKVIFLSNEFRAILDGALAEEYYPKIEGLQRDAP